jgi:hypothetical protein
MGATRSYTTRSFYTLRATLQRVTNLGSFTFNTVAGDSGQHPHSRQLLIQWARGIAAQAILASYLLHYL